MTRPLTDAPTRAGVAVANKVDAPRAGSSSFNPNSLFGKVENTANIMNAMGRGAIGGMAEGVGNVASDFTSPISIIGALLGAGAAKQAAGAASKVSRIAGPTIDVVDSIPVKQVAGTADDVASLVGDMQRNLARVPTSKSITPSIMPKPSPMMPAEMIPQGGEAAYNASRSMAGPTTSVSDKILDMMAERAKYKQQFGMR
jgi:hypothetical protein